MLTSDLQEILRAVDQGKAYAELKEGRFGGERYAFPRLKEWKPNATKKDEEAYIKQYFDNVTIVLKKEHIEVSEGLYCEQSPELDQHYIWQQHAKSNDVYHIIDGESYAGGHLCEYCEHFMRKVIGECKHSKYIPAADEKKRTHPYMITDAFDDLLEVKRGYIKEYEFGDDILFTKENIREQVTYYKKKGKDAQKRNKVRREICRGKDCLKYRTDACPKGWGGFGSVDACYLGWDFLTKALKPMIQRDFGSMKKAFWYFNQCGQNISYKDPNTNRHSDRLIAVPAAKNGSTKATGFFMGRPQYPFYLGDYHRKIRWQPTSSGDVTRMTKHEAYLSKKEYMQKYPGLVVNEPYKKKEHEELVYTIYALYRIKHVTPGKPQYIIGAMQEYDIALGMHKNQILYKYGNSTGTIAVAITNFKELMDYVSMNKTEIKKEVDSNE